jgi:hypothetical protein
MSRHFPRWTARPPVLRKKGKVSAEMCDVVHLSKVHLNRNSPDRRLFWPSIAPSTGLGNYKIALGGTVAFIG